MGRRGTVPRGWKAKDDTGERAIWAADIEDGRFVPVRAELETSFGTVVGRLKSAGAGKQQVRRTDRQRATEERSRLR